MTITADVRMVIRTRRLSLRRFEEADGEALHDYLSRPEAVRFEPYGVQSLPQCVEEAGRRAHDPAFWAVCLPASGKLVGNLYFNAEEPRPWRTYELGYVLHPDHWGRGFGTEAARGLLGVAFAHWGVHRVVARCNPVNTASWRLLERCGFRREGHLIANASFAADDDDNPIWQDTYLYGVLAAEWDVS